MNISLKDSRKLWTFCNIKYIHSYTQNNSCGNIFKCHFPIKNYLMFTKLKYINSVLIHARYGFSTYQVLSKNPRYREGYGDRIFYEPSKKSEYTNEPKSTLEHFKIGFPMIKSEIKKWQEELKETFIADPVIVRPGT
ncbi:hypothetical protein Avbf_15716 [Armadillidium vulgare]|nr:hypothetical protein Avbf_15716 [Armadillidium vulgare]